MTTVISKRLGTLHLGKLPARPIKGAVKFSEIRKTVAGHLPPIPAQFGHGGDFPGKGWLMLGNGPDNTVFPGFQGCGDCAWADPAHAEMEAARNAGRPVPAFSGKTIVEQYSEYSGYNPRTGENDNGSQISDVIQWRQTKGLRDDHGNVYKIGQAVELDPGNIQELWEAAYLFECVTIGVVLCTAQMDQFDAHGPWDYVHGSPQEGGHDVPVVGSSGLVTWAERHGYTRAFYEHQNDEAVAYVDPLRYSAVTGETAEHFADADLEKYLTMIVQSKG